MLVLRWICAKVAAASAKEHKVLYIAKIGLSMCCAQ